MRVIILDQGTATSITGRRHLSPLALIRAYKRARSMAGQGERVLIRF